MPGDNSSPLVIITGAARRIGREIALTLAKAGYVIGLHYHLSNSEAVQTAEEIRRIGTEAVPLQADLRDPLQISTIFQAVLESHFQLVGLVNSASVMPVSRVDDSTPDLWDEIFDVNLKAAWLCGQHAARLILPRDGWMVNITDSAFSKVWTEHALYNLSKSALQHLTRLQARTYAPHIRVNAVAPGLILQNPDLSDENWQRLKNRLPLSASGTPGDIARAVLYLAGQSSITGQTIVLDGGYQLI